MSGGTHPYHSQSSNCPGRGIRFPDSMRKIIMSYIPRSDFLLQAKHYSCSAPYKDIRHIQKEGSKIEIINESNFRCRLRKPGQSVLIVADSDYGHQYVSALECVLIIGFYLPICILWQQVSAPSVPASLCIATIYQIYIFIIPSVYS